MPPPDQPTALESVSRTAGAILRWLRRAAGVFYQLLAHDQIDRLRQETERLGAASVESATYLSAEVRELELRLAALQEEVASLRRALEERPGLTRGEEDDGPAAEASLARPPERA
jgi:ABC-type transporter Mla subunit MlaD